MTATLADVTSSLGLLSADVTRFLATGHAQPVAPPAVIVPPVVIPPVTPPVISGGLTSIWREDFTRFTSTADLLKRFYLGAPHMELSSGPTGDVRLETINGQPMMGQYWPGGGAGPTPTLSPRFNPPPIYSEFEITFDDQYSPNFVVNAELKAFLVKCGPNTASGMPQVGVYRERNGVVKMDITDRVHNINTGSPLNPGPASPTNPNTTIHTFPLSISDGARHRWTIRSTGLGSMTAAFTLLLDGVVIIGPLVGPFCPGSVIGGSGQLLIIEPGSNYNAPLPASPQSRWFSLIDVSVGI